MSTTTGCAIIMDMDVKIRELQAAFGRPAKNYGVCPKIPRRLFRRLVDRDNLVLILLEHIDYLLKPAQLAEVCPGGG